MRLKIALHKIRGLGFIFVFRKKYYSLWLEWADGGEAMDNGTLKTLWIKPRIHFVHT